MMLSDTTQSNITQPPIKVGNLGLPILIVGAVFVKSLKVKTLSSRWMSATSSHEALLYTGLHFVGIFTS